METTGISGTESVVAGVGRNLLPKWVGLLLGMVYPGLAHFMSGERAVGVKWYLALLTCGVLTVGLLATPGLIACILGVAIATVTIVLAVVVVVQSYRPIPRLRFLGWVVVVVIPIILGNVEMAVIRQFVCPFKVPTGAMQPTLMGVHARDMTTDAPGRPGLFKWVVDGERFVEVKASTDGVVSFPCPDPSDPTRWQCTVGSAVHFLPRMTMPFKHPGQTVCRGETLWSGVVTSGDRLLVERCSYWFRGPRRGDLIVFTADGIPGLTPGVFYVKRVVGLSGERIRIEPPFLVVNDRKITEPSIFATMSNARDGYAGFQLPAGATQGAVLTNSTAEFVLKPDEYFVLGDNTLNSKDSRYWGAVPAGNILGRATRIYWPFGRMLNLDRR